MKMQNASCLLAIAGMVAPFVSYAERVETRLAGWTCDGELLV